MWIVAGLGNPGIPYATTRHNVGFMVLDALALRWRSEWCDDDPAVRLARAQVNDEPVMLVQPQLFMNRSGDAVAHIDGAASEMLAVIYDDLDLPLGHIRVRRRGGSGGHRGVASMIERFRQRAGARARGHRPPGARSGPGRVRAETVRARRRGALAIGGRARQ
jgi:PTH1 family peptidyl-tRNA hydrolase